MCVVAHPDDECFGFGGALALAADRGIDTYVLCFTDGQAASARGTAQSGMALGQMRRAEFARSCDVLGVRRHEVLDFEDGKLQAIEFVEAVGIVVDRIRQFRPDVVVTFGPEGGLNTHSDHMMVSMITTAAFHWAGRQKSYLEQNQAFQPRRLFYLTTNFFMENRQKPLVVPWSVVLDISGVVERKLAAFREHVSQAPLMERTKDMFSTYGRQELYALAASPDPKPAEQASDLFAGL